MKQGLHKLSEFIFSDKLFSKNQAVLFCILVLAGLALVFPTRLKVFSSHIQNTNCRKIMLALSEPITDYADTLPFEKAFTKSRENVLAVLGVKDNYRWDNFYYCAKEPDLVSMHDIQAADPSEHAGNTTGRVSAYDTSKCTLDNVMNTVNSKSTAGIIPNESDDELLVVHYDYTKEHPLRILFAGDSLMQSIVEGFKRNVRKREVFDVTEMAVVSSGFVRTDYYNWPAKLQAVFQDAREAGTPYDAVVLILGMNDFQNFFDGNGKLFVSGSPEWIEAYTEKVKAVMSVLTSNVKKVYWLGLPTVKSPRLNADITTVEQVQADMAKLFDESKVMRISLRDIVGNQAAPYTDAVRDKKGARIQLMKDDGTHYTVAGGQFIMKAVEDFFYFDFNIRPRSAEDN